MGYAFTRNECIRALLKIGFIDKSKRKAKHDKFKPPFVLESITRNIKPFIEVADKFLDNLK